MQPRVAAADTIAGFHEEGKSPFVKAPLKTILHQGEVMNRLSQLSLLASVHFVSRKVSSSRTLGYYRNAPFKCKLF